jgi:aminoglycoside 2'-N-acetyltransferase I
MGIEIEIRPGDAGWSDIQPLVERVYPPEVLATIVWRDVTWAHAASWLLVHEGGRPVSVVGLYPRQARHDGERVQIGGIGGVMTHPEHRRRGFAGAALRQARRLFAEQGIDFALLFCEP